MSTTLHKMLICTDCDRPTLHVSTLHHTNHLLHFALFIFSGGLWLPFWIIGALSNDETRPACTVCGSTKIGKRKPPEPIGSTIAVLIAVAVFTGVVFCVVWSSQLAPAPSSSLPVAQVAPQAAPPPASTPSPEHSPDYAPRAALVKLPAQQENQP